MQKTKLVQLISKLKEAEIKAFDKFLQSPYFNNSPVIIRYWEQLKKYAPSFDTAQLSVEKLFKKIFPKEDFDEKKLRQLRSRLLKLLEEFLAIEQLKKDEFAYKKRVADAYFEKELKKEFEKKYYQLLKKLENEDVLTDQELHQKLSLHHQLYFDANHVKGDLLGKDLEECTILLDQYYTRQKLLYTIEWISINKRYSYSIPDNILNYCEDLKTKEYKQKMPIIEMLVLAVKLLLLEDKKADEVFYKTKKIFEVNYENISEMEKNLILRLLLNFCISKGDGGNCRTQDMFQLYQIGLSDRAIFYNGLMTNATFINIVNTALKLEKKEWATNFIEQEKYRLYEPQNDLYLLIGKASLAFNKKQYQDCLEILSKMNSIHFTTVEIAKRGLNLRATFECYLLDQSYSKTLFYCIESYKKFIKRKTILSDRKRKSYLHLVQYVQSLFNWVEQEKSLTKLNRLKKNLIMLEPFPAQSKKWAIKHIENWEKKMELPKQLQDS